MWDYLYELRIPSDSLGLNLPFGAVTVLFPLSVCGADEQPCATS